MSEPVFRAQALTKVYRMGDAAVHALRGVDLEIGAGEFIVLGCLARRLGNRDHCRWTVSGGELEGAA